MGARLRSNVGWRIGRFMGAGFRVRIAAALLPRREPGSKPKRAVQVIQLPEPEREGAAAAVPPCLLTLTPVLRDACVKAGLVGTGNGAP